MEWIGLRNPQVPQANPFGEKRPFFPSEVHVDANVCASAERKR